MNTIDTLKILLWNVWLLPIEPECYSRAVEISKFVIDLNPDVIVFNELFSKKSTVMNEEMKKIYPYVSTIPRQFWTIGSGIYILSKYPIIESEWITFSFRTNSDFFASKGVLKCKIMHNQEPVNILATHMQSGDSRLDQWARKRHSKQVVEFISKFIGLSSKEKVVFAGDLNMGPPAEPIPWFYSSREDMENRSGVYLDMVKKSGLKELNTNYPEFDICRILTKNFPKQDENHGIVTYPKFGSVKGHPLSDTACLLVNLNL